MTPERLQELLSGNFDEVVKAISVKPAPKTDKPLDQYNVEEHEIFDKGKRPDKELTDKDGNRTSIREVNRIGLAFQKMIVDRAAAFLCANPIVYKASPKGAAEEKMWAAFNKVNEQNKLDYKNQSILTIRMSETEVAEIWYFQDIEEDDDYWAGTKINAKQKLRLFISCASLDDIIWPVWDNDNLIAFAREWTEKTDDGKDVKHFDVYTEEKIYEGVLEGSNWITDIQDNEAKKISVIYHSQPDVEWAPAKSLISRVENLFSNFADSNDKTAYPILTLSGEVTSLPQGMGDKAIKLKDGAKADYLAPPNAAEAVKLEIEKDWMAIHVFTDTVDISPDALQNNGEVTGVAMEYRFMPAHLKASRHAGTFGECLQRRINLIKRMIVTIDPSLKDGVSLTITPTFDFFLPKDVAGIVNYLTSATMGDKPVLSQETAVNILQGAIGGDAKAEFDKIKAEREAANADPGNLDDLLK